MLGQARRRQVEALVGPAPVLLTAGQPAVQFGVIPEGATQDMQVAVGKGKSSAVIIQEDGSSSERGSSNSWPAVAARWLAFIGGPSASGHGRLRQGRRWHISVRDGPRMRGKCHTERAAMDINPADAGLSSV